MNSLIEKVARAISLDFYGYDVIPNDTSLPYSNYSPIGKCMSAATVAIEAAGVRELVEGLRDMCGNYSTEQYVRARALLDKYGDVG